MKWQSPMALQIAALALAGGVLAASPAYAKPNPEPAVSADQSNASIPFANSGNVRNWRATSSTRVYFQDNHDQWYRADLMGPVFDLPFVEGIGIEPGPTGALDQWGAVTVKGRRYSFRDFLKVDGPPFKVSGKAKDKTTAKSN